MNRNKYLVLAFLPDILLILLTVKECLRLLEQAIAYSGLPKPIRVSYNDLTRHFAYLTQSPNLKL